MPNLKDLAIQSALESKWEEAININLELLKENPKEIDTLNRLGFAQMQANKLKEAENTYSEVIKLDRTNPIALKNLKKLSALGNQDNNSINKTNHKNHMDNVFIQEAGKTKTVDLTNVADKKTLMTLQYGDDVELTVKRSKIFVLNSDKTFIGMLPDSIGIRLASLMKGGNEYQACIKGIDEKNITVFIKEVKRAKKFSNLSSFS